MVHHHRFHLPRHLLHIRLLLTLRLRQFHRFTFQHFRAGRESRHDFIFAGILFRSVALGTSVGILWSQMDFLRHIYLLRDFHFFVRLHTDVWRVTRGEIFDGDICFCGFE